MLSNHADAFFLTPMKLRIETQATSIPSGMPAPRPLSASATKIVHGSPAMIPRGHTELAPGMGEASFLGMPLINWVGIGAIAVLILKPELFGLGK